MFKSFSFAPLELQRNTPDFFWPSAGVSLAILVGTTLRVRTPRRSVEMIPNSKVVLKKNTSEVLAKAQAAFATAARAELQRAAQRTEARRLEEARIVQRVAPMAPMDGADTEATATSGTLRAFGLEFVCCLVFEFIN